MDYVENKDGKISLKISGDAMDSSLGFELKYLLNLLSGVENLIEKTYLFSDDRSRMRLEDHDNLKIIIDEPKRGSFEASIFVQIAETMLPLAPYFAQNGVAIWKSITQVYEYLKLFIDARKEGKSLEVNQHGDGINATFNNTTINIDGHIPDLANILAPYLAGMSRNIDGKDIKSVNLASDEDAKIDLTIEDKERFKSKTFLNDEYTEYEGKVFSSDSKRDRGEIETNDGVFTYNVHDSIANESTHDQMYLSRVRLKCRERIKIDPSQEPMEEVLSLEVYGFEII